MREIISPKDSSLYPSINEENRHDAVFDSVDDFFKGEGKDVISRSELLDWRQTEYMSQKFGSNLYELETQSWNDGEATGYTEEWKKNGEYHRSGDFPAKICCHTHQIASEMHLDKDYDEFYLDGQLTKKVDKSHEDFLQNKPLSVRQAFEVDLEQGVKESKVFSGVTEKILGSHDNKTKEQEPKLLKRQQKEDLGL